MINMNLKYLRKKFGYSQEYIAEKLNVSRQSVAKWENGESFPDIIKCSELANIYETTIDCLLNYSISDIGEKKSLEDKKYVFGVVKVGERGQVVIPKNARDIYNIQAGDKVIIVGDARGIAMAKVDGASVFDFTDK